MHPSGLSTSTQDSTVFDSYSTLNTTSSSPHPTTPVPRDQSQLSAHSPTTTSDNPPSLPVSNHMSSTQFPSLPEFIPVSEACFVWGTHDSEHICKVMSNLYLEVVHWRKCFFKDPYGQCGQQFVSELACLFRAYGENSSLESIELMAVTVVCILLLQKPHINSKDREHPAVLARQMKLWQDREFAELLAEGRAIQQRLYSHSRKPSVDLTRSFTNLMFQGRTKDAMQLITEKNNGCVMKLDDCVSPDIPGSPVLDVLKDKHPLPQPCSVTSLISPDLNPPSRHYGQCITEIEHCSFSPLVFSSTGGMAKETTVFYKRLASLLSYKWDQPYSVTMGWLRCTLGFSLLKSFIQCIRGARSTQGHAVYSVPCPSIDVIHSKCQIS